jgi:putative ABC transport system permease protein
MFADMLNQFRYAVRGFLRSPTSSVAAVLSLGLGIGMSAAVFSIGDAVLFRSLNVPRPSDLVNLYQRADAGSGYFSSYSYPLYEHLRDHSRSFLGLLAWDVLPVNGMISGNVERLSAGLVSNNYFQVLGTGPTLGRAFLPEDENVVVIGDDLWQNRFGRTPDVLDRTITLNDRPFRIVGVLPRNFQNLALDWTPPPQVWVPMTANNIFEDLPVQNAGRHWLLVTGRLKAGVRLAEAQAEVDVLSAAFYDLRPEVNRDRFRPVLLPAAQSRVWPGQRDSIVHYIWFLGAVAALATLMACFNVANLMLSRAAERQREIGIRVALGAGRMQLAGALFIEAAVIAFMGVIVGILMASLTPMALERFQDPLGWPMAIDAALNLRVVAFAATIGFLTALLIGVSPVRAAWRADVKNLIQRERAPGRMGNFRLVDVLVAVQFAICVVSLAGAGMLFRTLRNAQGSDPMFRSGNALLVHIDLLTAGYDDQRGKVFYREFLNRVRQLPGVASAGYVKTVPLGGLRGASDVLVNDRTANVQVNTISSGYLESVGLPVIRGRDLRENQSDSILINEQMAERFWPGEDPIGKVVSLPRRSLQFTVAGVVRDGRMRSFREPEIAPCIYLPLDSDYQRLMTLSVQAVATPLGLVPAVRSVMHELGPDLAFDATTLEVHLDRALSKERLAATMLSLLSAFTTLLAAVGLYGLVSAAVCQRLREIGIRIALGARRIQILAAVTKKFAVSLAVGSILGLLASIALGRLVQALLFGVKATDPISLAFACGLLATVSVAASLFPAMRAVRTDPISSLRQD